MEQQIDRVFELIRAKVEERKNGAILIVGIGGVPGAGKSLFARRVIEKLNENDVCAVQVPMDGFHFYRAELDKFDDPAEAHRRRGTDFTFDFDKYFTLLKNIRENRNDSESIWAPTFEHKVKDPSENAIKISMKTTKVVVSEGNYVCFDKKPWNQLLSFLDLKVFVKCELEEAEKRVVARHQKEMGMTKEQAVDRWNANDKLNAIEIIEKCPETDVVFVDNGVAAHAEKLIATQN
mmetsp:Transcript_22923/g.38994  ORF Transcript_22923/g.38994 Transcript_22923/m.38994 type:complete len:235 (+) Transcript_22923:60-764(+)